MSTPLLEAYKRMMLIRTVEQEITDLYLREKIMSFVHFCTGQEAVAVGVCDALEAEDRVHGNHRSHGHYLAKGGDPYKMIAELLGKKDGCAKGKGGSMHMIDKTVHFVGSTPILGSVAPLGAGTAFEQKYSKRKTISVAFIGDGASEEGVVYETINLAALLELPYLLVIENNLQAVNSRLHERRNSKHSMEKVVTGLGARYVKADGNDYEDVVEKARELVASVRNGDGPAVLECITYRHMAHSAPIFDENYREEDTLEKREETDPLKKLKKTLVAQGTSEETLAAIDTETLATVRDTIDRARAAEYPAKESLYTDLYV